MTSWFLWLGSSAGTLLGLLLLLALGLCVCVCALQFNALAHTPVTNTLTDCWCLCASVCLFLGHCIRVYVCQVGW